MSGNLEIVKRLLKATPEEQRKSVKIWKIYVLKHAILLVLCWFLLAFGESGQHGKSSFALCCRESTSTCGEIPFATP